MTRLGTLRTRLPAQGVALVPAAALIAVVIAWASSGGGYESQPALGNSYQPDGWYLGALALVGLFCATLFGLGGVRVSRASRIACAAFAGYVLWSFASVLWAHDQGTAFLGSDRALVYLAAFGTFAVLPWRSWSARAALATLTAGIGALALLTAIKVATLADPGSLYIGARLSYPLGYYNADAALFMTAAVCAIALVSLREGPFALRVAGLPLAALCLQLALLSQSRGWLFSAPLVLVLALALVPGRVRVLAFALGPVAATAAVAPALLRVYRNAAPHGVSLSQPRLSAVLHQQGNHAVRAILIADLALAVIGALLVAADRRVQPSPGMLSRINRLAATLALAAALGGVAVGLIATHGDPLGRLERAWHSFASSPGPASGSHFTTLANNRADIWRVALHEFAEHPLGGIGQDNFATSYTRLRHTYEQPRWTHSIELRLLTHTGIVGAFLFALFLLSALFAALRGRCRGTPERVTAGLLLLPLVVWLVQGSIEWFWEYPALSVPALAFTAAAGALGRVSHTPGSSSGARRRSLAIARGLCASLLCAAALAALVVPFLAARKVRKAMLVWPERPALAYSELRSATNLLPFDAQLYLVGGAIALDLGDYGQARVWLARAERHEGENWVAPFALGMIESESGHLRQARAQLLRAFSLNPREEAIAVALKRLGGAHPLTFSEAQGLLTQHITTPRA